MVSLVNSDTNAASKGQYLWEIGSRFALSIRLQGGKLLSSENGQSQVRSRDLCSKLLNSGLGESRLLNSLLSWRTYKHHVTKSYLES